MQKQFSIAEAKNKLPSIIHDVESGPPVELTRRGVPVAVLLSKHDFDLLTEKQDGFWNVLMEFRRHVEQEGIIFSDADFSELRDSSKGRNVDLF